MIILNYLILNYYFYHSYIFNPIFINARKLSFFINQRFSILTNILRIFRIKYFKLH
jgi:hypothetical protein